MSNTTAAIMALPAPLENIRLVGDEDKHATLLFFGETSTLPDDAKNVLVESVKLACAMLFPFSEAIRDISRLGDDTPPALVVKLSDRHLSQVRNLFVMNPTVKGYLDNTQQFPSFTPHVTLGHPDYAEEMDQRVLARQLYRVNFDRLAVWWNDERIECSLTQMIDGDSVAMSEAVENFLEHFGVKGQKWGVTRAKSSSGSSSSSALRDPKSLSVGRQLLEKAKADKTFWHRSGAIAVVAGAGLAAAALAPALLPASVISAAGGSALVASKITLGTGIAVRGAQIQNSRAFIQRNRARVAHADISADGTVGSVYDAMSQSQKNLSAVLAYSFVNKIEFKDDDEVQNVWTTMSPEQRSVALFLANVADISSSSIAHSENIDKALAHALPKELQNRGPDAKWLVRENVAALKDRAANQALSGWLFPEVKRLQKKYKLGNVNIATNDAAMNEFMANALARMQPVLAEIGVSPTGIYRLVAKRGSKGNAYFAIEGGDANKRFSLPEESLLHDDFDIDQALVHAGIKGMKWGVRRKVDSSTGLVARTDSADQIHADRIAGKIAKGGTSAASNRDLKDFAARINAEQEFNRANHSAEAQKGQSFVNKFLKTQGQRQFNRVADKAIDIAVEKALSSAGLKIGKNKPGLGLGLEELSGRLKPKKKGR